MMRRLKQLMNTATIFRSEALLMDSLPEFTYLVYDTWQKDLPVYVGDSISDIARFLGITVHGVREDIRHGYLVGRRYGVEKVKLT